MMSSSERLTSNDGNEERSKEDAFGRKSTETNRSVVDDDCDDEDEDTPVKMKQRLISLSRRQS